MGKWYFLVFTTASIIASLETFKKEKEKKEFRSHVPTFFLFLLLLFFFTGKSEQRDFLATGAACGICTAFRAPLAGKFLLV